VGTEPRTTVTVTIESRYTWLVLPVLLGIILGTALYVVFGSPL
jgi:uncharacterized membrane protein YqhA